MPSRAFISVDLPRLNRPATTTLNLSSASRANSSRHRSSEPLSCSKSMALAKRMISAPSRRPLGDDRLCVTHGQIAVTNWKIEENRRWIASAVHRRTVVLAEEVRKFIDKHDYQRKGELAVKDDDAVQRAMRMLVGSDRRSSQDEAARQ